MLLIAIYSSPADLLHVAHYRALRHVSNGLHIADGEGSLLPAVDELQAAQTGSQWRNPTSGRHSHKMHRPAVKQSSKEHRPADSPEQVQSAVTAQKASAFAGPPQDPVSVCT